MKALLLCLGVLLAAEFAVAEPAPQTHIGRYNILDADIHYRNPNTGVALGQSETRELVIRLYNTRAVNHADIVEQLALQSDVNRGEGFASANPYYPRAEEVSIALPKPRSVVRDGKTVHNPEGYADIAEGYELENGRPNYFQQQRVSQWFSDVSHGKAVAQEVCAVKFTDAAQQRYELKTFANGEAAKQAGWTITHQYHCGTCSTLQDLAAYMGIPDQTTPVRACTKKGRGQLSKLDDVKQCIIEEVGFTEMCAESWAYNGIHTGAECALDCMRSYGRDAWLSPLLRGVFNTMVKGEFSACPADVESDDPALRTILQANGCPLENEKTGKLNACLWCDEKTSGPGFKYTAARTRRGSGLPSAIPRPNDRLFYEADHSAYFND